ncbi:MAG TPA: 4Fe-4S dicluster domain-containing protein [Anaerolineaceae bacterium]|nr:4Fe-4S dicluster domain-containing protein [Anaerolineaceae bacterium]
MKETPSQSGDTGSSFLEEVIQATPGDPRLEMCIQCGTCAGSCPSGADMDHTPRAIFAMIRADMREEVFQSNTPWFCISCYYCTVRCPQEVHITDLMYTLKSMALRKGYARNTAWADFSKTFNEYVFNYGKAFELGLATRFTMRHASLRDIPGLAQMGMGMMARQRMSLIPQKINGLESLQKVLTRAEEIEEESR